MAVVLTRAARDTAQAEVALPPVAAEALPVVEEALPVVEEALPVVEEAPPVVEEALPVVEEAPPPSEPSELSLPLHDKAIRVTAATTAPFCAQTLSWQSWRFKPRELAFLDISGSYNVFDVGVALKQATGVAVAEPPQSYALFVGIRALALEISRVTR